MSNPVQLSFLLALPLDLQVTYASTNLRKNQNLPYFYIIHTLTIDSKAFFSVQAVIFSFGEVHHSMSEMQGQNRSYQGRRVGENGHYYMRQVPNLRILGPNLWVTKR